MKEKILSLLLKVFGQGKFWKVFCLEATNDLPGGLEGRTNLCYLQPSKFSKKPSSKNMLSGFKIMIAKYKL